MARHFADKACAFCSATGELVQRALDHLSSYTFPGNVRELKGWSNARCCLCEGSELLVEHFSLRMDTVPEVGSLNLRERLEQIERSLLLDCLRKNDGNQTLAARELACRAAHFSTASGA
jgi:sigma-54-dependent transcriptional regulator